MKIHKTFREQVKELRGTTQSCIICNCRPEFNRIVAGGRGYYLTCPSCYQASKTKQTIKSAIRAWNKQQDNARRTMK